MYRSDTTEEVQREYDRRILSLSEEERFLRGISLTRFCRQMCLADIRDRHPTLSENEIRILFFERIYGHSFPPDEKKKIHRNLRRSLAL